MPTPTTSHRAVLGWADSSPSGVERADRSAWTQLDSVDAEVRIFELPKRLEQNPHHHTSVDPATATTAEFLAGCDFFWAASPKIAGVSLLRPALEAMASGCVVIADDALRPVLGNTALYLSDGSVQQHLAAHPIGSQAFTAQQRRSVAFCAEHLTSQRYADTIRALLQAPAPAIRPKKRRRLSGIFAKRQKP